VATHPDPEPTTDWSLKICLLVHLGRISKIISVRPERLPTPTLIPPAKERVL
jgi:hypothetical protein